MNTYKSHIHSRALSLLLALALCLGMLPISTYAAQDPAYHDPTEHWISSSNRTNELDANAVLSRETFHCYVCDKVTSFTVFRTAEYTRDGKTALSRNVRYSDGTMVDGVSRGSILDGVPGVDATYTGYHWSKAVCETCGTLNTNMGQYDYCAEKNLYLLNNCAAAFMQDLDEVTSYQYTDATYHTKTTTGGQYCVFCFGTHHDTHSTLERHNLNTTVTPELAHQRFVVTETCADCGYSHTDYVAAKAVVANFYGTEDGAAHTVTVSDLSDAGVSAKIRYGNSASSCTLTSAPNYTTAGEYSVYYQISYSYKGAVMEENGVAFVHLHEAADTEEDCACPCGCKPPNCGCKGKSCDGTCCKNACATGHHFAFLDTVAPSCSSLGYDRYLCADCGFIEKRNYKAALGHAMQGVLIREATCEAEGKLLNICARCGEVEVIATPKGEHSWTTYNVPATCTSSGYTVKECSICGERHITNITATLPHNYKAHVTPATCESGGSTLHLCDGCGSSFVTDYTASLGHSWDEGHSITTATCTGEGVTEFRCVRCGYHRLEGDAASGHNPGEAATCTAPQLCLDCGAVLHTALGHDYKATVTPATCKAMGHTVYTCSRCGDSYTGDYTDVTDHHYHGAVTAPACEKMGFTTYTCADCGAVYTSDYTEPTGHKAGAWIIDKAATTTAEGSKHKACTVCGKTLETAAIEKLYMSATTDTHGEAVVGGYLVTVTDTASRIPVSGAGVVLNKDGSLAVRLPDRRLLDFATQTTVTVQLTEDKFPVAGVVVAVTDKNDNYAKAITNKAGQFTVPGSTNVTNEDGMATVGWMDADKEKYTLTVEVRDYETGRPISGADVAVGTTGNITVTLPRGVDMDENNRITVTVWNNKGEAQPGITVTVKGDLGGKETGDTDTEGGLIVPAIPDEAQPHNLYIVGYDNGNFGPEDNMTRCEAAAIFARLLADRKGDKIYPTAYTDYDDIPAGAWYAGYARYLTDYGVTYGRGNRIFAGKAEISRAEFVTMAVRFFEVYDGGDSTIKGQYTGFADVSSGYWAAAYIRDAALRGWIKGYSDNLFHGDDMITRAEAVTIVNRLLGRVADKTYIAANVRKMVVFPDVPSTYWAYYDIMEAANGHLAYPSTKGESWAKK